MYSINHKIACLTKAAQESPEYAEILPLFIELFRHLESAGDTGIYPDVCKDARKEKIEGGFPLIAPENVKVDEIVCRQYLKQVIETLRKCGKDGQDELQSVASALDAGTIECATLFRAILARERRVIDDLAMIVNAPSPLVEYLFEIPLKRTLEVYAETIAEDELTDWQEGYCPVCGSRAGMAELVGEEGKRHLSCSSCNFCWPFKRLQCPFCGNQDPEKLTYFSAGSGATRVDACKCCSRYIKTRDSRKGNADVPLDVEDLLTIHLDFMAAKEGFERGK